MDVQSILGEVKRSCRALARKPGFTCAAVLCISLGVSSSVAVFTLVRSELLRPLPYRHPQELVSATAASTKYPEGVVLDAEFVSWRAESHTMSALAAWNDARFVLAGGDQAEEVHAALVNGEFLDVLGVRPLLGRGFALSEDQGKPQVALLGYRLWTRLFHGDSTAVGRVVLLNDQPCEIVGVLPQEFRFPGFFQPDLLVPGGYSRAAADWSASVLGHLNVIGRLADGVTTHEVAAEIAAIQERHTADLPTQLVKILAGRTPQVRSLSEHLTSTKIRTSLLILMGAVGLVILIVTVNVAGLQLARVLSRRSELSVRAALGATKSSLAWVVLAESMVLSLTGTVIGIAGALALIDALPRLGGQQLVGPGTAVRMDATVVVFALGLGFFIACVCGVANIVATSRFNLKDVAHSMPRSVARTGRYGLVAGQVAIAFVLLIGAGLLLRSFANVLTVDTGLRTKNVLTVELRVPVARYNETQLTQFAKELIRRIHALPGVEAAAATNSLPFTRYTMGGYVLTDAAAPGDAPQGAPIVAVSEEYFKALGMALRAGEGLRDTDGAGQDLAAVNASFARRFFASGDPMGRTILWGPKALTVVGVVADDRHAGPEQPVEPEIFIPYDRSPGYGLGLVVRTSRDPESIANAVRNEIRAVDKGVPILEVSTLDHRLFDLTGSRRFQLSLIGAFAMCGLVLAGLGLYGSIANTVNESRRDIAVRMALGAEVSQVRNSYLRFGLGVCMIGLGFGAIGSIWLVRYVKSLLFHVRAIDPISGLVAAAVMLVIAVFASYFPALSASRTDPNTILRHE